MSKTTRLLDLYKACTVCSIFMHYPIFVIVIFHYFILYVQDILKDYLDKRERGDLVCQKRTSIAEVLNQKVSYVDSVLTVPFLQCNFIAVMVCANRFSLSIIMLVCPSVCHTHYTKNIFVQFF